MATWPAKEDRIQATIRAFEGYMPYFRDVLSIETFNLVESMITRHRNDGLVTVKSELLLWLDGFDCTDQHESTLRQRQQTTAGWLFREQLYTDWRNGSIGFIWLHGKAGAGKSVLASAIVDNISNELKDNETLAYFYCDFRNNRCTSAMEVLRSVAKQFLWNSKNDWLPSFADLITRKERGARPPTDLDMLSDLLERAAGLHAQPIVFVDALDECEDMSKLLDQLVKLSHGHCRLFVTSRTLHTVEEAFTGLPSISLDERVDEVRNDMYLHVKTELQSRSRLKTLRQALKDEIEVTLMRKADGMFRWVQCQLDRLNDCWSVGDVREVLDTLPQTLYGTYDRMIDTIDKTEFGPRIARRALLWLVLAPEPLKLSQLAEALTINGNEPSWDITNAPMRGNDILEICGSLIVYDKNNGIVTLSHYSVKEYLISDAVARSAYFVHRPLGCLELASTSIYSVMLYAHTPHSAARFSDRFCFYAVRSGFKHLASCPPDRNKDLVDLLLSLQDHVSKHRFEYATSDLGSGDGPWVTEVPQLALYIITRFGHLSMLRYYLDCYPVQATEEDNPLVYAALYSDLPHVQLFLEKGLDVNAEGPIYASRNVYRMSPLTAAARNERPAYQEPLIKLLLSRNCIVPTYIVHSALQRGVGALCNHAVIRILLDHGASPTLLIAGRKSPLHLLLERSISLSDDDFMIACMLVTAGCDPLALDDSGFSPFHYAINAGDTTWIQWLLQTGFQFPPDAILHIHREGHSYHDYTKVPRMVQFLISRGASVQVRDAEGCNAFHRLVRFLPFIDPESMVVTVCLLLHRGCDINCKNELGETPLHLIAAKLPVLNWIVEFFVAHGAQPPVDIVNYSVMNPFLSFLGVDDYVTRVLEPLVSTYGASCQSITLGGDNALHCLSRRHALFPYTSRPAAEFLLENGCNIHAVNSSGATPLHLAIENGHISTAQLILSQLSAVGSSLPNVVDPNGNGSLHRLCIRVRDGIDEDEFVERLTILQEAGQDLAKDINRPNNKGFTPLCIILRVDRHVSPVISVLLDLSARFSDVTPFYIDGLDWASNLPWYREAVEAYQLSESRFKPCFDDITQIYHFLSLVHLPKIPPPVARLIMDMAECWAYTQVIRNDVRYTIAYGGVQVAFPATPIGAVCWVPHRVIFSCKPRVFLPHIQSFATIDILVGRPNATFIVPVKLRPEYSPSHPPKTVFDVWDKYTPATEPNGKGRLTIAELTPGDSFSVEFRDGDNDYFELEFFQVEVYYVIGPARRYS
ncbi:hypothetical protein L210DRAFT_3468299 [Boletus edulis BED1]|uniref:NACHT domain-containing protein n=1 Tax=Boletus edulis BED1 TaxID=1328754 RepID=A0AAD4C8Q3_BOLED|nr:hypothetical protein L210DRAFT_3468299 [Boletus edulis BED1]